MRERFVGAAGGGERFLQDFPFQRYALVAAGFENTEESGFFGGEIFFGIDAAIDGEPAFDRDHVEIVAATAFPA